MAEEHKTSNKEPERAKCESAKREEEILRFWKKNHIFEKSLEKAAPNGEFVFYEGPPTANGRPGIHHLEARAFKDAIPRYRTMRGFHVRRKGGWDTHGLPVELEVEKQLGLKSKKEIESYGVAQFNEKCRESVWKYVDEWRRFTERSGYWVDLDHAYVTYRPEYIEAVWGVLKHVHDRGLLYKDYKVVPWCPRCGTALSSHELAQGYQDVKDLSVTVKFKVKAGQKIGDWITDGATYILAWTTTPWTLPGNVGLAVGNDIEYVKIKEIRDSIETNYIVAWDRVNSVFQRDLINSEGVFFPVNVKVSKPGFEKTTLHLVEKMKGVDLVGLEYEPLYPFLGESMPDSEREKLKNAYKVYAADFVTTDEGTGIVHTAVMYGQDDFELGTKVGLPKHHLVDESGHFIKGTGFLEGKFVRDEETAIEIIKDLAHRGLLFKKEKYEHSYPHCWRCKTPLIYYARDSWYIRMSALRDELVKENEVINWIPAHIKEGRFGEWLREVKDWAISRERYWGTPLPVWRSENGNEIVVIDSLETLKRYTKKSHNTYVLMRHGEALWNTGDMLNADPRAAENHLTLRGIEAVDEATLSLKERGIDLIVHSPLPRARETAERVACALGIADVREDPRLAEVLFGEFEGKSVVDYHAFFGTVEERFTKRPEGGETWNEVKRRATALLYELDAREHDRRILFVSHNGTLQMLRAGAAGLTQGESAVAVADARFDIATAEVKPIDFIPLPHNADYELDLHRPYIDEVVLVDVNGTPLSRVSEVLDVWFDSGAVPFAQDGVKKGHDPVLYPADFISEAIDQTRGWFYTLHAIGVLMGCGKAYKNVISLGHILDEKGKKMSKSVGNVVNPWDMMERYGADALRFWMYTVNQPGDSKNFDEKTIDEVVKKVFNLLDNIVRFHEMYKLSPAGSPFATTASPHVLDRWIRARLAQLITDTTRHLEQYRLFEPARDIRDFIADFSQWYIRRSRERFKEKDSEDNKAAIATTRFVLHELARVMAPFTPFVAEEVYQKVRSDNDLESVHLCRWPEASDSREPDADILITGMDKAREVAAFVLRTRENAGIPVKQPLGLLMLISEELRIHQYKDQLLQIIKDEVNVKEIEFGGKFELDTTITPELKREGQMREFVRAVQDLRKKANLAPHERAVLSYSADEVAEAWMREHSAKVSARTKVEFEKVESVEDGVAVMVGGGTVKIGRLRAFG